MRRTARLFALAEFLRGHRTGVTAEKMAERFGVTMRTIYRDLEALQDASLPLRAERGRGGGFALDRAYTLPPINFSPREAALLVLCARYFSDMRVVPFIDTLQAATDKVRAALSASAQRELLERLTELRFTGVPARETKATVRRAVEQAWFEQRPLRITYKDTVRTVRIDGVVMERSETLLNCFDLDKEAARQFKLDRIVRAEVVDSAERAS